ncbi:MAG: arginine--tRNA ligase [Phycisphaerae bacterium]
MSIEGILRERFSHAIGLAFGAEFANDPMVKPGDPKFADYQCNAALGLSKQLGRSPRELAAEIVRHLEIADICELPQIAGPGFINVRISAAWLAAQLGHLFADSQAKARGGVERAAAPATVVVDYAGPNIAKEMHVGHLRSSILGDAIARMLAFVGHQVVRQNHVGDFGTQFGMLIRQARDLKLDTGELPQISDLDSYYKQAAERYKSDPQFATEARQAVVALQNGDPEALRLWRWIREESRRHCREIFELLNIALSDLDERGESFYARRLPEVVRRLSEALAFGGEGPKVGLLEVFDPHRKGRIDSSTLTVAESAEIQQIMRGNEAVLRVEEATEVEIVTKAFVTRSEGALCVFLPGYVDKDKKPLPLIIRKGDGAYLYATTDLAALYFRIIEDKTTPEETAPLDYNWHADRIIYTTDARQAQHFAMVFDTVRAAHWDINPVTQRPVELHHAVFGSVLGEDGKPFKTRSGESVKLRELLAEAVQRAEKVVMEKNPDLPAATRKMVARAVGISAVKYADLRQDRTTDYQFAWDRMLALEGNTGPYLQYTFARIRSIFRKAGAPLPPTVEISLQTPREQDLGRRILQFNDVVAAVLHDLKPHYLCTYMYELCGAFSSFYENCPVLKAATPEIRQSRLALCELAGVVLNIGWRDLLGLELLEEM